MYFGASPALLVIRSTKKSQQANLIRQDRHEAAAEVWGEPSGSKEGAAKRERDSAKHKSKRRTEAIRDERLRMQA
jgi:hypothetical protein